MWKWKQKEKRQCDGPQAKECGQPVEAGKGKGWDSLMKPSEGMQPCQYLTSLRLLTSRSVREYICTVLSHRISDNLLQLQS